MTDSTKLVEGAVTFLDVLGWKGIWSRQKPVEAVAQLQGILRLAEATAQSAALVLPDEARGLNTDVKSISDTIVLQTRGAPEPTIGVHAAVGRKLVCKSLECGLPLRGATTWGRFLPSPGADHSIVVGPAVDDAASWHENADWIGITLAPSALFRLNDSQMQEQGWVEYRIPLKGKPLPGMRCLDWRADWTGGVEALTQKFASFGAVLPEFASKHMNTLEFVRNAQRPSSKRPKPQIRSPRVQRRP